jgi:glucose/arabinose dehydrogenase
MLKNADPRIFTYGHRNVQGIDFHPETGQPFIAEHGPGHSDEVTPLRAGANGGWDPKPEAGVKCADNYCGYVSNRSDGRPTSMTDTEKFPNAMQPVFSYSDSEGLSPCTFVTHSRWGSWKDRLLIGFLAGQRIDVLNVSPGGVPASVTTADLPSVRYRGLVQGPNGYLYVITDADKIWQVVPN